MMKNVQIVYISIYRIITDICLNKKVNF